MPGAFGHGLTTGEVADLAAFLASVAEKPAKLAAEVRMALNVADPRGAACCSPRSAASAATPAATSPPTRAAPPRPTWRTSAGSGPPSGSPRTWSIPRRRRGPLAAPARPPPDRRRGGAPGVLPRERSTAPAPGVSRPRGRCRPGPCRGRTLPLRLVPRDPGPQGPPGRPAPVVRRVASRAGCLGRLPADRSSTRQSRALRPPLRPDRRPPPGPPRVRRRAAQGPLADPPRDPGSGHDPPPELPGLPRPRRPGGEQTRRAGRGPPGP